MELKGHQAIKNLFKYAHKGAHTEALKGCFHKFFFFFQGYGPQCDHVTLVITICS